MMFAKTIREAELEIEVYTLKIEIDNLKRQLRRATARLKKEVGRDFGAFEASKPLDITANGSINLTLAADTLVDRSQETKNGVMAVATRILFQNTSFRHSVYVNRLEMLCASDYKSMLTDTLTRSFYEIAEEFGEKFPKITVGGSDA